MVGHLLHAATCAEPAAEPGCARAPRQEPRSAKAATASSDTLSTDAHASSLSTSRHSCLSRPHAPAATGRIPPSILDGTSSPASPSWWPPSERMRAVARASATVSYPSSRRQGGRRVARRCPPLSGSSSWPQAPGQTSTTNPSALDLTKPSVACASPIPRGPGAIRRPQRPAPSSSLAKSPLVRELFAIVPDRYSGGRDPSASGSARRELAEGVQRPRLVGSQEAGDELPRNRPRPCWRDIAASAGSSTCRASSAPGLPRMVSTSPAFLELPGCVRDPRGGQLGPGVVAPRRPCPLVAGVAGRSWPRRSRRPSGTRSRRRPPRRGRPCPRAP